MPPPTAWGRDGCFSPGSEKTSSCSVGHSASRGPTRSETRTRTTIPGISDTATSRSCGGGRFPPWPTPIGSRRVFFTPTGRTRRRFPSLHIADLDRPGQLGNRIVPLAGRVFVGHKACEPQVGDRLHHTAIVQLLRVV